MASEPLVFALTDKYKMKQNFPQLSSFETKAEISRWDSSNILLQSRDVTVQGLCSMKVSLKLGKYSGAGLKYFPSNWEGMKGLQLAVLNPQFFDVKVTFRIHDGVILKDCRTTLIGSIKPTLLKMAGKSL